MFKDDKSDKKVNLGVGAYRDEVGNTWVLQSVKTAEQRIADHDKEYTGIGGIPSFVQKSMEFAYGADFPALKEGRIAAVQSISGTGGCRVGGEFLKKYFPDSTIYTPDPTWGNHPTVFQKCLLKTEPYRYYDRTNKCLDFAGMKADMERAAEGSIFLLHACAHNPTGCDPSKEQWDELSDLIKRKRHIAFFDNAYQGFASGNPDNDAYSFRSFAEKGHNILLSQSYAKNFGLYGERVGTLSVVTNSPDEAKRVTSQLNAIIRPMYSSPPIHGALIVSTILSDPELKALWYSECKTMADRILEMRTLLAQKLEAITGAGSWRHITDQIGMFCYTGLTTAQVLRLRNEYHIYCTDDGRFSIAGINMGNVDYLAQSVAAVL